MISAPIQQGVYDRVNLRTTFAFETWAKHSLSGWFTLGTVNNSVKNIVFDNEEDCALYLLSWGEPEHRPELEAISQWVEYFRKQQHLFIDKTWLKEISI
jgi:hypothetical protein